MRAAVNYVQTNIKNSPVKAHKDEVLSLKKYEKDISVIFEPSTLKEKLISAIQDQCLLPSLMLAEQETLQMLATSNLPSSLA